MDRDSNGAPILPLLPQYMERACVGIPVVGIAIPAELAQTLIANGLTHHATVTDGNCGVHAFGQALLDVAKRNRTLYNTNKFKTLVRLSNDTQH